MSPEDRRGRGMIQEFPFLLKETEHGKHSKVA